MAMATIQGSSYHYPTLSVVTASSEARRPREAGVRDTPGSSRRTCPEACSRRSSQRPRAPVAASFGGRALTAASPDSRAPTTAHPGGRAPEAVSPVGSALVAALRTPSHGGFSSEAARALHACPSRRRALPGVSRGRVWLYRGEQSFLLPLLVDSTASLSCPIKCSPARCAPSLTDHTDSTRNDSIHAASVHGHEFMKPISHLQEVVFSSFGEACLLCSCIIYVLPPSCIAEPCEQEYSLPNMPLLFAIAMVGATVGGLLARQRRGELARLNDQLRQINAALRRQAKIESYAPALSYAPVGSKISESEVIVDPQKERLIAYLRTGKNYLRNQAPDKAFPEFKAALDLAQSLGDHVEEKKAARGLGASLQRQGKYKEAINYHSMVLNISKMTGEDAGVTEAYGAIADCYTELGELEKAGKFYDKYIARLENE